MRDYSHYTPEPGPRDKWRRLLPAACVLALFLPLLLFRDPGFIPTELGPQQVVHTSLPKLAVHTRLTDEVEPWKIKQSLVMVRQMGAGTIVEYFPWAYIEPEQGQFNWNHADLVVDHALRQGLHVVARLDYVPDWARAEGTTPHLLDESHFADYAAFVEAFVTHFQGRVDAIVIWNEPNLAFEWGGQQPDAAAYTRLLAAAYAAAKRADPNVQVLAGALAPVLEGDSAGQSDLDYLDAMYAAGAAPYFDGLAMHAYGWSFPPDDPPAPEIVNFRRVELLRAIMERHGDGLKPSPITEAGWNDHPRWTKSVRPAVRIDNTLRALQIADGWTWCPSVALWAFRFPWRSQTYQDNWALVDDDFSPRPIYQALAQTAASGPQITVPPVTAALTSKEPQSQ
ncbi:MAG: endo-1,4-beta-xylanase [Anaerolineae bacterium]